MLAGTPAGAFAVDEFDESEDTEKTEVIATSSMEEIANEVDPIDGDEEIPSDYAYKSLILDESYTEEIQAYGAEEAYYYDGTYLLKYGTEEDAQAARDALAEEYGEDAVIPNIPLSISDTKRTYGWGTDYMNMDVEQTRVSRGDPVTVAVVDTGIAKSHSVFAGREIVDAYDFVRGKEGSAVDDNGHGTAVCGIIAESTPNNVKIMPIKALDARGYCDTFTALAAIEYAQENGADIVNLSFGGYASNRYEMDCANDLFRVFTPLLICASGNESLDMDKIEVNEFPAELDNTVSVGSFNIEGERSDFSNYGTNLDFAAPGDEIAIADYKGGYVLGSGTSFSSPYVAAAAALIKAENPGLEKEDIISDLQRKSIDMGNNGKDPYYGIGCPKFDPAEYTGEKFDINEKPLIITNLNNKVYTGQAITFTPRIITRGRLLKKGEDYTVNFSNNVNAGTASMTIEGINDFEGNKTVSFKIAKAANTISAAGKTAKVKKSKVKKKKQTLAISKLATISRAQGAVTYTKLGGSGKLSINGTTGKVTVKKKTKKGTYKMHVRITASGNGNYEAASRYVTLTVKVK